MKDNKKLEFDKWIIYPDGQIYGSQNAEITDKLEAGVYSIHINKANFELYLMKNKFEVDELIDLESKESRTISEEVVRFWKSKDEYVKNNFLHKRGLLMVGPPGTGKTSIINMSIDWFIKEMNGVVLCISSGDDLDRYSQFHKRFRSVEPERPLMVLFEDIDGYLDNREGFLTSKLLNILDGNNQISSAMYIATTNFPEKLPDSLITRPGRFDIKVEIKPPSKMQKEIYLKGKITNITVEEMEEWLGYTEDMNMSFISEMVKQFLIYKLPLSEIKQNIENFKTVAKSSSNFEKPKDQKIGFNYVPMSDEKMSTVLSGMKEDGKEDSKRGKTYY